MIKTVKFFSLFLALSLSDLFDQAIPFISEMFAGEDRQKHMNAIINTKARLHATL
jgi:hypothetical protein